MERVIAFDSEKDHYTADACVVWCFDDRFYKLLKAFGKQQGFRHIDLVKAAGGAKALAGDPSPDRDFLLGQIKASIRLHGPKRIILMVHRDCGGYGGSKSFPDAEGEKQQLNDQLLKAKSFVEHELGEAHDMNVEAYFADFDGIYAA